MFTFQEDLYPELVLILLHINTIEMKKIPSLSKSAWNAKNAKSVIPQSLPPPQPALRMADLNIMASSVSSSLPASETLTPTMEQSSSGHSTEYYSTPHTSRRIKSQYEKLVVSVLTFLKRIYSLPHGRDYAARYAGVMAWLIAPLMGSHQV